MEGNQVRAKHFFYFQEIVEVSAGKRDAGIAVAFGIQRLMVGSIAGVSEIDFIMLKTARKKSPSMASQSRRGDAVKGIDPGRYRGANIVDIADPKKMDWSSFGKVRRGSVNNLMHLKLASAKTSSDSGSKEGLFGYGLGAVSSEIGVGTALNNSV